MKSVILISMVIAITLGATCRSTIASPEPLPLKPFEHVDLNQYAGLWYEIAHYPNKVQEGCNNSIVRFSRRINGEIDILNSCRDKQSGKLHHVDGVGWLFDKTTNARLKVSFFWPFRKEYIIIDQGKEYEYSVICTSDRKHLWIIARSPSINSTILENILLNIEKQGFQRALLVKTEHAKDAPPDEVSTK